MSKIKIMTDSTADLSAQLLEQHDIDVVPLYAVLGDKALRDGVEVTPEDIYAFVAKENMLPKTSAASVDDYMNAFKKYVDDGYEVVHFNISSKMSSSYQNACIAAEEVGNVYVVDSENLSTGSGLLVLDAADMRDAGMGASEIAEKCRERTGLIRASFVVDNLEYLRMGGRCSAVAMLGANLLKIKPRIEVNDGAMGMGGKYRGAYTKVILDYTREVLSQSGINKKRIFVTHTKCDDGIVESVIEAVKNVGIFEEIYDTTAGCVITSHCGPNTLGVLFELEK